MLLGSSLDSQYYRIYQFNRWPSRSLQEFLELANEFIWQRISEDQQSWQENMKYHTQDRDVKDARSSREIVVTEEAIFGSQRI